VRYQARKAPRRWNRGNGKERGNGVFLLLRTKEVEKKTQTTNKNALKSKRKPETKKKSSVMETKQS